MGTPALKIVRFRSRYYIRYHQYDGYWDGLGAKIVASIPTDPEEYQKWLASMRAEYSAKQNVLESHVYNVRDGVEPDYPRFSEFETLPSEFPRLDSQMEFIGVAYFYIINLDQEVLTMNHSIHWHWKLENITRKDNLWLSALTDSIYRNKPTISLDVCPEEHMASPALEYPKEDYTIDYCICPVTPRECLEEAHKVLLTFVMANTLSQYSGEIIRFGLEWSADSFPFRELAFALVSVASGQARFHSFPAQNCDPRSCERWNCESKHLPKSPGWLDKEWAGGSAPLLEFGTPSHRPGEPPGASPAETMYWLEDVLISLVLVVDGKAISEAVTWGLERRCTSFQIVVLSLFQVAFADVSFCDDGEPFVQVTNPIHLSPLQRKPGMTIQYHRGELLMQPKFASTRQRLEHFFPGLAALVNFFEVAASRRAAAKSAGIFPAELYDRILNSVDYDTWKACLLVSTEFRSRWLRKYRLDDRVRIVAGPFVRLRDNNKNEPRMCFDFENSQTGEISPMMHVPLAFWTSEYNWMPVIGHDRKVLMLDIPVQFDAAAEVPVEDDYNDHLIKPSKPPGI
ncbi:hypothetical protein BJY04DRAFT_230953 [Aspergillus karnatakaensis]|uniref:uncharacterized protein n=1 Tax=Aspergillus karnatakaensis TaxID=1810916 RepID=UPI003CCDFF0A